eukprot:1635224-Pleurochrysis_carterae.AAC.1
MQQEVEERTFVPASEAELKKTKQTAVAGAFRVVCEVDGMGEGGAEGRSLMGGRSVPAYLR